MTLARLRLLAELLDEFGDWCPHPSRLTPIDVVIGCVHRDIAATVADLAVEGSGVAG
jgi:hypothetical protein